MPFQQTRRWARGQVLRRLREVPGDAWLALDAASAGMPAERLDDALLTLQRDGMLEVDARGRARLPRD